MIQLEITTPEETTLTEQLKKAYPDLSNTRLRKFYSQNRVMKNEFLTMKDATVKKGEKITFLKKPNFVMDLLVYYEDRDVIVVEKPPFVLSVDSDKNPGESVHATLKKRYGQVFPVQRLDRETTGVMVFAFTKEAKDAFWKDFEEKRVDRSYVAILYGALAKKSGTWKAFISEGHDKKMRVDRHGKEAITHFTVKKIIRGTFSFIECILATGRKNQIRVHAQLAGHSLVGDCRYGTDKKGKPLFLHAHKLAFTHPRTGRRMSFISPIPNHFRKTVS